MATSLSRISSIDQHAAKVARVVAQIRESQGSGPLSLHKRSVSHQIPKAHYLRRHDAKIDVGELTEILEIDPVRRICVAESGVTFVDLVTATLRHGLVPVVAPELKTITVGGAVAGCSLESMSFARGGFHDTCVELDVVTSEGRVLTCTRDNEHRLVFDMVHGAFGTLGIITRLAVVLSDSDGSWQGPVPVAFGALVTCEDGAGIDHGFWTRFATAA